LSRDIHSLGTLAVHAAHSRTVSTLFIGWIL
jgi:hypothetical protein